MNINQSINLLAHINSTKKRVK